MSKESKKVVLRLQCEETGYDKTFVLFAGDEVNFSQPARQILKISVQEVDGQLSPLPRRGDV